MNKERGQKSLSQTFQKMMSFLVLWHCLASLCPVTAAYARMYQWTDKKGITYNVDDLSKLPPDYRVVNVDGHAAQARPAIAGSWIEKEDQFEFKGDRVAVRLESDGTGYSIVSSYITSFWSTVQSNIQWRQVDDITIELFGAGLKNNRTVKYNQMFDELENGFGGSYPLRRMKRPLPPAERAVLREKPILGLWMSSVDDERNYQFIVIEGNGTGVLFTSPDYFISFTWTQSNTGGLELKFQPMSGQGNNQTSVQSDHAKKKVDVFYNENTPNVLVLSVNNDRKYTLFWISDSPFQGFILSSDIMKNLKTFDGRKKIAKDGNAGMAFMIAKYYLYQTLEHRGEALPWLTIAAERGIVEAQYMLGHLQYFGEFTPVNKEEGLRWMQRASKSNYASAMAFIERIGQGGNINNIFLGHENPSNYWERGAKLLNENKYDEAIDNLTKAIILNKSEIKNIADVYNARARVYMRKAQYSEALSDLNNALKSDDKNATHYIGRGLVYKKQEKYLEALQEFNKASEVEPKNYRANYQKASVYSLMNKIQETCDELEKAIDHGLSKWEGVKTAIQKNADFDNIRKAECWSKALSRI